MSETKLLVIECERPDTECAKCSHGSDCRTRRATAADIPADLAAEALGMTVGCAMGAFEAGAEEVQSPYARTLLAEAARRVREAEQAKGPSDANRW